MLTVTNTKNSSGDEIYPNVTSLYFATPLAFNDPDGGFPWDDLRKILHGGQRMAKVQNGEQIFPKVSTPWVRHSAHERYKRQTTDGFAIAKSRT